MCVLYICTCHVQKLQLHKKTIDVVTVGTITRLHTSQQGTVVELLVGEGTFSQLQSVQTM